MTLTIGQAIWASVKPIIKIYLIIGSGIGLAKLNILTVEATRCISDIVLTLLLPSLSFNKIVANIEDKDIKQVGIICLTSVMLFATGLFFAYVCRLLLPVPKQWRGGILCGGMFPNISDLPIAYLQTMDQGLIFTEAEGNKGVANVIIFLAMFMMCVFNLGGFRLIEMDFSYHDEESALCDSNYQIKEKCSDSTKNSDTDTSSMVAPEMRPPVQRAVLTATHSSTPSSTPNSQSYGTPGPTDAEVTSPPIALTQDANVVRRRTSQRSSHSSIMSNAELRESSPQDIHDLVREYSHVDEFGRRRSSRAMSMRTSNLANRIRSSDLTRIVTSDATVTRQDVLDSGKSLPKWIYKLSPTPFLVFFLKNCLRPCSMAVIVALTIAFIPWVKALFVTTSTTPHIKQAPDNQPALSFIMDFTSYVGAASVPFGLLLLGATLGRLKINKLYPGFWKTSIVLIVLKMCVMPIFGVLWCDRLVKAGWANWEDDRMLLFVIAIDWALPTMTTMIYFTASYTPVDAVETVQLDCVSFFLMLQYPLMIVSLPFLVTYFLKVQMKV
ncbi:LAMI_0F09560g1_1 [Lachancea mirantina]|uniref:LAMI_0F09560g1_1 n=1 Tax=Lachancea mirantina TaxID=1230905 RepID=A0A1G4K179_9SACH|nr:LAMI_0F09560g1_1 [Lachancea mirantina]